MREITPKSDQIFLTTGKVIHLLYQIRFQSLTIKTRAMKNLM
jgi:hypothetical protein